MQFKLDSINPLKCYQCNNEIKLLELEQIERAYLEEHSQ